MTMDKTQCCVYDWLNQAKIDRSSNKLCEIQFLLTVQTLFKLRVGDNLPSF